MRFLALSLLLPVIAAGAVPTAPQAERASLERLRYRHAAAAEAPPIVDLGVGLWAWPVPWDVDQDGDIDLVVVCPDKPSNGTYFFENRSGRGVKMPVFA
ncbi:MAG: VCBS repeat-containing protein, partial [Acidobacteriota bacterium]